ncbi:MAG: glucoamylase family protein [Bacteroidales bacterium]
MKKIASLILLSFSIMGCSEEEPTYVVDKPVKNDQTYSPAEVRPVLEQEQKAAFNFFYEGACPVTGLALEGNNRGPVVTTGGSGFGLMSLIIGAERNWISRQQAADQTLKIVRFLGECERFKGMWSHWYNPDGTAHAFGDQVKTGDVIESAFLMSGLLTASEYFQMANPVETEIRDSVASLWNTVDWNFYTNGDQVLHWLWYSEQNKFSLDIRGWHEGWISYLFALAAPAPHNISESVYNQGWLSNGGIYSPGREHYGYPLLMGEDKGGCMFFAHYSFVGLDPRMLEDNRVNYWQQNVCHTMINRHYCIEEAPRNFKYSEKVWGLTACYGARPPEWNYTARSPHNDDGVIAPTASLGSFPYTPFYSTQALLHMASRPELKGEFGLCDSFCPETNTQEKRHLAIDQGPIVVMIENYRSGLIWNLMMKNEHVRRGLRLAGVKEVPDYKEGFPLAIVNTKTKVYDMMMHPDREKYEIAYYSKSAGKIVFQLIDKSNKMVRSFTVDNQMALGTLAFDDKDILKGQTYHLKMKPESGNEIILPVCLR